MTAVISKTTVAELEGLLLRARAMFNVKSLGDLVDGILAAPSANDADSWMQLVAPKPAPELATALRDFMRLRAAKANTLGVGISERPSALRAELRRRRLAGFVVPRADEHQGEYVSASADRLAWLTGFTGSAGMAIILRKAAAVFVDGRYTLQVQDEVDSTYFECRHVSIEPVGVWLAQHLKPRQRFGYDPWMHTPRQVAVLREACEMAGARLVALDDNPVDAVWIDQPPPPLSPVRAHGIAFAGRGSSDKRSELAAGLAANGIAAALLTAPDSIAWLLNVRGGDVPCTPLPLSFALLYADACIDLFIDARKLVPGLNIHLGASVRVRAPGDLGKAIDALGSGRRLRIDSASAPDWAFRQAKTAGVIVDIGPDPCQLPKACKNETELAGARAAHCRDGAALTRFLAWLAREAPSGHVGEIEAATVLESFRATDPLFRGLSFPTISGAGSNGAIVHYRASEKSEQLLRRGSVYLVDSGGQYLDGTTDVTRTVAIGTPDPEMCDRFTRVLKGHIGIATARFPAGTNGGQLDTLARRSLWEAGLDFDHGTGHGVGSYLGVHEGPQRISKAAGFVALEPGMIISNEPGYYKAGSYGIRIENLVAVKSITVNGAERSLLGFDTLTLAPIDRTLVDINLLSMEEISWLNAYHARVLDALSPAMDRESLLWLKSVTRPIADGV